MSAHFLRRHRRFGLLEASVASSIVHNPTAIAWYNQVVSNGGAAPAQGDLIIMDMFCNALDAASITNKIGALCFFNGPNLIQSTTPLIRTTGNALWTNNNFVSGDLSISGLVANGSSKYLTTGIIPFSAGCTTAAAGVFAYVTQDDATGGQSESAVYGGSFNSGFGLWTHYNTTSNIACAWRYDLPGTNCLQNWTVPSPATGFYSFQRTTTSRIDLYFASSVAAHSALAFGTGTENGSVEPTYTIPVFAANSVGTIQEYSRKRLSCWGLTKGLSAAEDVALYTAVQQAMVSFGGGYV